MEAEKESDKIKAKKFGQEIEKASRRYFRNRNIRIAWGIIWRLCFIALIIYAVSYASKNF